jgi:predicted lipoprotein with Yx(FWY)xxD motif
MRLGRRSIDRRRWTGSTAAAALLVAFLGLGGCSASSDSAPAIQPDQPAVAPAHGAGLFVVERAPFGRVVIDGGGFVLYRYDRDQADPSRSACVDPCTKEWLVEPAGKQLRVVGIDREQVGQLTRPDGTVQLTLAGWPLYGYAGDKRPGDINGQGADGQWHLIAPDGAAVAGTPSPAG